MAHLSTVGKGNSRNERGAGRGRHPKGAAALRPAVPARNDFLNQVFEPLAASPHKELRLSSKVQCGFFPSLSHLSGLYDFNIGSIPGAVYPRNLHLAFQKAKRQLHKICPTLELRVIQEGGLTALATVKTFDTGQQLTYIPVKPYYLLRLEPKRKATANLLLSLYSLLYRRGVSDFSDMTFLGWQYDMVREWLEENPAEWDAEEHAGLVSDIRMAQWCGDRIARQLRHPYHARQFAARLKGYRPQSDWEREFSDICRQFGELFSQYPDGHFHRQIRAVSGDEDNSEVMAPEHYLSFFWTDDDSTYETLMEAVQNCLQECGTILEPTAIQVFDREQDRETHDFYFEWRFMLLTDHLCHLLFNMP